MRASCLLILLLLVTVPVAFAEDIVMSVDQSDYYFVIGEKAIIPLGIQNNNVQQISGMLQYMVTQNIMQGNAQVSSTNTQATSFILNSGQQRIELDFGTSNSPSSTVLDLSFIYNNGTQISVSLDPITVHFVEDESQKNNTPNQMQSSSQQQQGQNTPNTQQSVQQRLDELANQQTAAQQDPQQKLQNNQMAQDSAALKKEIQEQLQQESDLKKAFEEQLTSNEDFQESHQQLLDQGYSVTDKSLDPDTKETGDFEIDYQNEQGEWGKVQGSMTNGTITEIQQQTEQQTESLLEQLRAHPDFLMYDGQLGEDGFSEQNTEFTYDSNMTVIEVRYHNSENQTASIYGEFESKELKDVFLERADDHTWLVLIPVIGIASYIAYRLFKRNRRAPPAPAPKIQSIPYDSDSAVKRLIREGKNDYNNEEYKDAYGKINQALRIFLSHKLDLHRELTNENILERIPKESWPVSEIKECFKIASLVEFAKYAPNNDDFYKIVSITEDLVNNRS